jgi:hypothetical protein
MPKHRCGFAQDETASDFLRSRKMFRKEPFSRVMGGSGAANIQFDQLAGELLIET